MERTLAIFKPEALQNPNAVGEAILSLDKEGLFIRVLAFETPSTEKVESHYYEHKGKDYFERLVNQLSGERISTLVIEGVDAVAKWRKLIGSYREEGRDPNTLRGKFMEKGCPLHINYFHGSDSVENAEREIGIWFPHLQY